MTRVEFFQAMLPYRDSWGFPAGSARDHGTGDPSGNCLMFWGEEAVIRHDLGLDSNDSRAFATAVGFCQLEPGNYSRTPKGAPFHSDQEGWDDFIGITTGAALVGAYFVIAQIILFGRRHFFRWGPFRFAYSYPTSSPAPEEIRDPVPWFGRYLQFVAHLRWCAGETPNPLQRLVWFFAVAAAGWNEPQGQDPWRLSYLMLRAQKVRRSFWHFPERLAEWIWRLRFLRHWPGGIRDVRARYFNDPNHPLARFASMEF